MDGVLVDNTPVHVEAFARFCERYGVTDWRGKLAASYGMGNDDILRRLLPPELIRERGIESLAAEKERLEREVQKLRERSIRLEERRYSITTHSAVVRELERRGIPLADPAAPVEIIEE